MFFGLFKKKENKLDRGVENTIKELQESNKQLRDMLEYEKQHMDELKKQLLDLEEMIVDDERDLFVRYVWCYISTFYSWGGNTPAGFDCSGIANEGMQAVGKISRKERLTAEGLRNRFIKNKTEIPYRGCLVFWYSSYNPDKIIHVEICLDNKYSIGASGGGSKTKTKEDAIRDNAFIKVRPFNSRPLIWGFVDPFKKESKENENKDD